MSAFFVNLPSDAVDRLVALKRTTLPRGSRGGQKPEGLAKKKRGIALPAGASPRVAPFGADQGSLQTLTDPEALLDSLQRLGRGCDPRFAVPCCTPWASPSVSSNYQSLSILQTSVSK
jgi:hypothetical protein